MTNPIIYDGETHRPMTDDEYAAYLELQAETQALQAKEEAAIAAQQAAKESAQAKLAALGLTDDEINALIP